MPEDRSQWREAPRRLYAGVMGVAAGRGLDRFPPLRLINGAALRLLKQPGGTPIDVRGHRMMVDPNDSLRLTVFGEYLNERFLTDIIERVVTAGDVVIDVGANIGYHTLIMARATTGTGVVHAVEPFPANLTILHENLRLNGYDAVIVLPFAASDTTGEASLFVASENTGDHRLFADSSERRPAQRVTTRRLDDVIDRGRHIRLVKIDIQGSEGLALAGMRETLHASPEAIVLAEFWPYGLDRTGSSLELFFNVLDDELAYSFWRIDEHQRRLTPITREGLEAWASTADRYAQSNLLCAPAAIGAQIADWMT